MTDSVMLGSGSQAAPIRISTRKNMKGLVYQALTLAILCLFVGWVIRNTIDNLARANISSGFGFLQGRAGFDISQSLIDFSSNDTYAKALLVGILNTLLVAAAGIVLATILGFLVGVGRLSSNWLIARICEIYVELFRNIPPLLIVFFWYVGVLAILPQVKQSMQLPFSVFVNNRGIFLPKPVLDGGVFYLSVGLAIAALLSVGFWFYAKRVQVQTGKRLPVLASIVAVFALCLSLSYVASGASLSFDTPALGKFRLEGGMSIGPEFLSLLLSLSFYTGAYIAEIVRSGIMGVPHGQNEAAKALGLSSGKTMRLVVIPQALRIVIPPLTSQYLNLVKDTSLAIAVGYADLVSVGGTIMNQTGQAVEIIAIWACVYLTISLLASAFMNWFNKKMALPER